MSHNLQFYYCADCFNTELVVFVSLFAVKVCGAKREKLMNFLVSSIKQEYSFKCFISACFCSRTSEFQDKQMLHVRANGIE